MTAKGVFWSWVAAAAGLLAYGAWTSDRWTLNRTTLRLPRWPGDLDGFRIGVLGDQHLQADGESIRLCREAIRALEREAPDVLCLVGDLVGWNQPASPDHVAGALQDLDRLRGRTLAVLGNHDYFCGDPSWQKGILAELGVRLLVNESASIGGVTWLGVDSGSRGDARPYETLLASDASQPIVCLWHEPDLAELLPRGIDLALAGHSHGGQFTFGGFPPVTSCMGSQKLRGFYPEMDAPLFVTSGLSTTGFPARLGARAEAAVLTIRPSSDGVARAERTGS